MAASLDAETVALLDDVQEFYIQQRIRWGEAITQGCFEQKNIYDVFEKETNRKIMVIKEESGDCTRCCCAPGHSLFAHFYLADSATGEERGSPVMTMEREGCDCCFGDPCPKPCLCCWACTRGCSDNSELYKGNLEGKPGEMKGSRDRTNILGESMQPIGGGGFKPIIQMMDREDASPDKTTQFAALRGPMCFGGCSENCCDVTFGISKAKDGMGVSEIKQLNLGDYASIVKLKPRNLAQALRETFTDADIFDVTFKDPETTALQKANVIATMVLIDYMFFERDNDMIKYDAMSGDITITCCNCFCYGCVCPCSCTIPTRNSGD